MIDAAFKTPEAKDLVRYLYMLSKLVKVFHEKKWIVRCFTARDIWKTGSKKVSKYQMFAGTLCMMCPCICNVQCLTMVVAGLGEGATTINTNR